MASKRRDYAAEYARRIARGKARGVSRSVAAGHPKTKTTTPRAYKGKRRKRVERTEISLAERARLEETAKERGVRLRIRGKLTLRKLKNIVKRDAEYVFGEVPKRTFGVDDSAPLYQLRLEDMASRDGLFDWQNEHLFIAAMMGFGRTEREAYTLWFSPGGTGR